MEMVKKMLLLWFGLVLAAGECFGMTVQESTYIPGVPFGARSRSTMSHLALSPDESTLYAAYWTSDSPEAVMAYSTLDWSHRVVFTYGTCHGGVVLSPDGRYVYATTYYQGGIARYDTQTGQVVHLGLGSWGLILSGTPDGNSLLATYNEWSTDPACNASLALVNVAGGAFAVVSRLSLGGGPTQWFGRGPVTYSADGDKVYLVTSLSKTSNPRVLEISFAGTLVLERSLVLPFSDPPTNVVRAGSMLYVGSTLQPALIEIDLATFLPTGREFALDQAPFTLGVHPDDRHIFVLHDAGALSVIDAETGAETCSLTDLPSRPVDIKFTADGRRAFVLQYDPSGETGGIVDLDVLTEVEAEVDLKPETLNPRSYGRYLTTYIELPEGYDVTDIDVGSVCLAVEGSETLVPAQPRPVAVGDYDRDGVRDLMVKFDRRAVEPLLTPGETATVYVGGLLADGTEFLGSDTVRVLGMVNIATLTFLGQVAQANETACGAAQLFFDSLTSSSRRTALVGGKARQALRLLDALLRRSPDAGLSANLRGIRQAVADVAQLGAGPSGKIGISEVQLYSQARYVADCFAVLGDCYDFERRAWLTARRTFSSDCDLSGLYQSLDIEQAQIGVLTEALEDFKLLAGALHDPQRAQQLAALADDVQALLLSLQEYAAAQRAYVDSW